MRCSVFTSTVKIELLIFIDIGDIIILRHKLNILFPLTTKFVFLFLVKIQALIRILRCYGVCEFVSQQIGAMYFSVRSFGCAFFILGEII